MNKEFLLEIKRNKKLMNISETQEMITLSDENYSNVNVDNDTKNDRIPEVLLKDINTAAKNAGLTVTITTAKTGHGIKTKSNALSRHATEQAVDIAIINGIGSGKASNATNGNPKFRDYGNKFVNELVKLGYVLNQESGNEKAVLWQTNIGGNHYNHVHISNKSNVESQITNNGDESLLNKIKNYSVGDKTIGDIIDGEDGEEYTLMDLFKLFIWINLINFFIKKALEKSKAFFQQLIII